MAKITRVWSREILDSRGIPTVEVACQIDSGHIAVTSVPAGTSTGAHEALELRDADEKRYSGKGVLTAVNNINKILGPAIVGMDPTKQFEIDKKIIELDGTENKSKYGSNAILAISEVISKMGAIATQRPLYFWLSNLARNRGIKAELHIPTPLFNMINGGLHGAGNLDFQEFLIIPASIKKYSEGLMMGVEIYTALGENLAKRGAIHSVGNEGGYAPNLYKNGDALEILVNTIMRSPYELGRDLFLGLDVAASVFYRSGHYHIKDRSTPMSDDAMLEFYAGLNNQYHLALIEDPFAEDDWESWKKLYKLIQDQMALVGDDLLVTNPKRVEKAIKEKACNTALIKPNQIGTITETLDVIKMAREAGWRIVVSHRSGETNDWFIADFAVAVGADYMKFGAPSRGERVAKYNRLSSIELELP